MRLNSSWLNTSKKLTHKANEKANLQNLRILMSPILLMNLIMIC